MSNVEQSAMPGVAKKKPCDMQGQMEAEVGIEPAYADLQSAA